MESSRSLVLLTEEVEELSHSNKKVKNVVHSGYQDGQDSPPSTARHGNGAWNQTGTFKDRLIGEIPGAYTQAFSFGDHMDDDLVSDEEVDNLREGLVAVKFSKEFKHQIRSPWNKALIVKVFGRSVGFNYLHNKLLALWKPAGRLDCVSLGQGFFLTRLSLKEDYEAILRKGPWFIGGHFLSIRPWEPDFRPATANVSSVAVWIRLNELPIEYYNAEALHQIGKSVGIVLRVDTHTATETKGKFARLCVQIDVNKPLTTAILIGKFEQPVCYEGIQKLCFGCGRMGHQKEVCSYTIRQDLPPERTEKMTEGSVESFPCDVHANDRVDIGQGSTEGVNDSAKEETATSTYGPWVVVTRRKHEARNQRYSGSSMGQGRDQPNQGMMRNGVEKVLNLGKLQSEVSHGPAKEMKRKLANTRKLETTRELNGPILENVIQRLVKNGPIKVAEASPTNMGLVISEKGLDPKLKNSVKGKKALARIRYIQSGISDEMRLAEKKNLPTAQGRIGDQNPRDSPITLLNSKPWTEMEFQFRGDALSDTRNHPSRNPHRDEEELNLSCGLGTDGNLERMEVQQSDRKGSLPIHAGTKVDGCEDCAMEVSDGFSISEDGAMVEGGNESRFQKPLGKLSVSKLQGGQSSQDAVREDVGADGMQRGFVVDCMVLDRGGGDDAANC